MMITDKTQAALAQLLRLAREEHAAVAQDLIDIAGARRAAIRSLANLTGDVASLARRRRVRVMLTTYEMAEAAAQEKLGDAQDAARRLEDELARLLASRRPAGPIARTA